ncbi:MAG TPA: YqgE/AlgH family protein [Rhizomicrobium sp.]|nr:YqgE/AlgH family protein [Rhizomicrobium sp.]
MSSLTGQLLIAMPQMGDPFFDHSVVYLCAHSEENGAMGIIVNKTIDSLTIDELYTQLKIEPVKRSNRQQPVHFGGPVATGQGFVLHSADYRDEGTLGIGDEFALTATVDILRASGKGEGPRQCLVALGYAGWGPGQLDSEIQANGWLLVAADTGLVFDAEINSKWQRALAKLGVSPEMLSGESGRA